MFLKIVITLVVIIGVFISSWLCKPADFCTTRTAAISAPPDAVFAHVNSPRMEWSPWAKASR